MWPYTNDEAGWLTPPKPAEREAAGTANDNAPARRLTPRPAPQHPPAQDNARSEA